MENEFVGYDEALVLRELGFNNPCIGLYEIKSRELVPRTGLTIDWFNDTDDNSNIDSWKMSAPLYQQAFKFLREKYGYDITIKKSTPFKYSFIIEQLFVEDVDYYFIDFHYKSYEEAQIKCLKKLIEIVKRV